MPYSIRSAVAVILCFCVGCAPGPATRKSAVSTSTGAADWLAQQRVVCGEVRGRVIDARTGAPLANVYVAVDTSTSRAVATDSLGRFRFIISPSDSTALSLTRATTLRVRQIGMLELRVYLPPHLGYAVEASLGSEALHVSSVSASRIKVPAFCDVSSRDDTTVRQHR